MARTTVQATIPRFAEGVPPSSGLVTKVLHPRRDRLEAVNFVLPRVASGTHTEHNENKPLVQGHAARSNQRRRSSARVSEVPFGRQMQALPDWSEGVENGQHKREIYGRVALGSPLG